jgi:hypothetical protein
MRREQDDRPQRCEFRTKINETDNYNADRVKKTHSLLFRRVSPSVAISREGCCRNLIENGCKRRDDETLKAPHPRDTIVDALDRLASQAGCLLNQLKFQQDVCHRENKWQMASQIIPHQDNPVGLSST